MLDPELPDERQSEIVARAQEIVTKDGGVWHGNEPWDTYCLIGLWLWCGWVWLRTPRSEPKEAESSADPAQLVEGPADIGGPHESLADQHRADARGS